MLVYGHVRSESPPVGVVLHTHVPEMVVKKEISFSDDDEVVAVEWQYRMSGRYLTSNFLVEGCFLIMLIGACPRKLLPGRFTLCECTEFVESHYADPKR